MKSNKPVRDPETTVLRLNGKEYRFNEKDRQFVLEVVAHDLGLKSASVVQVQQTADRDAWQVVILEIDTNHDYTEEELFPMFEDAQPQQKGFMITYKTDDYENILKARSKRNNNVFDLFLGYQEDIAPGYENEPA